MDVAAWCGQSRVWVVAGKGGVGKTTISAVLAATAAAAGLSVLVIELEGKHGLGATFGRPGPVGYPAVALRGAGPDAPGSDGGPPPGAIWARRLTPDDALLEYLSDHGLQRVSRRLVSSGVLDVVATAIPGIRDVLVLGKVKQLERAAAADMVVLDAPATGHAMTFLTSASGLLDAARGGPVRQQAADVVELLRDPDRCRVLPVTLPEEMPVSETVESARLLADRVGIHLGPVVVNCFEEGPADLAVPSAVAARDAGVTLDAPTLGALEAARTFRLRRLRLVDEQVDRLERELRLPQLRIPRIPAPAIGPDQLDRLAAAMSGAIEALPAPQGVT
ncbi:MAG TPA: ArsA-related P-loop ATPase [Acidimicrobiales bacterium]|nr:ArsA-related P-loop ATPase [Acidimicrobiales bacterium]